MTDSRDGKVVTFYSYKGGTGRTMALANVAWILAANGRRVLVVDWDLESPGLHRFFSPFAAPAAFASGGVIDLIRDYESAALQEQSDEIQHEKFARVQRHAFSVPWRGFPAGGQLDFLGAGRQDRNYMDLLAALNWDNFYDRLGGGEFFDALRVDMKRHYDYTLIDSRTGLSDIADICTIHLPDILVDCFTLSEQGIEGAAQVAREVRDRYRVRNIRILPMAMRIDPAEKAKADAGRAVAKQRFAGLPAGLTDVERDAYWTAMHVPYQAFYAYEETLATFGDVPGTPGTLLSAYEVLTRHITEGAVTAMPPMDEGLRTQITARFVRQPAPAEEEVTLRYTPEDHVWAEWIQHVLTSVGVRVHDAPAIGNGGAAASSGRSFMIISQANRSREADLVPAPRGVQPPLAVYVDDELALSNIPAASSVRIKGQSVDAATTSILRLAGFPSVDVGAMLAGGPRFPGTEPDVFSAPARNRRFTGREHDLRQLRSQLRSGLTAVVLPVALQGMGGIGKTQVAMEYAYRFRTAYDLVWWIDAGQANFVDVKIGDLASQLGLPAQANAGDNARAVLQALKGGSRFARWLVILDNADDFELIGQYLPQGTGHVLITSRNPAWSDRAQPIQVDVFDRRESVAHLATRVPGITMDEADRVAELLGDLPIAVAAAGAWLAETGETVDDYLVEIREHGTRGMLSEGGQGLPVEATWDLSLHRLQERSPAAYRLLQLCSVMAPEIALDLVYSDELASALIPVDASVSERLVRGSLVQSINRLALLKLDQREERGPGGERLPGERPGRGGQLVVHRLLQQVVRSRMTEDELNEAKHQVHLMLAASRPSFEVDDPDTWGRYRMLWPHLELSGAVSCPDQAVRQLLVDRVRYLWLLSDLNQGRDLAGGIETAWSALLESTKDEAERLALRRQLLHLRFNLANILRDLGRFEESRALDEAGLPAQRELLGAKHPHTLMSAGGLAGDLRGLGLYREALELDEGTYAAWADTFGDDHPRTLTALSNLAVCHRLIGDFAAAYERDMLVQRRRRAVLSENHPNTLLAAGNIGRDLRECGEVHQSIEVLEAVAETYSRVWGEDSRGALGAQANLAVSLRAAGHAAQAAGLLERAYERLNNSFGKTSPETLACRLSRAMNLLAMGDNDLAHREADAVKDAYQESLGPTHPHTLVCVNNLAAIERARDDNERAVQLARQATQAFVGVLGPDHPYTLAATTNLAICTAEAGDLGSARAMTEDATVRTARVLGPDHPDTLRCHANEALILRRLGLAAPRRDETDIFDALSRRIGEAHPAVQALKEGRFLHRTIDPHPF